VPFTFPRGSVEREKHRHPVQYRERHEVRLVRINKPVAASSHQPVLLCSPLRWPLVPWYHPCSHAEHGNKKAIPAELFIFDRVVRLPCPRSHAPAWERLPLPGKATRTYAPAWVRCRRHTRKYSHVQSRGKYSSLFSPTWLVEVGISELLGAVSFPRGSVGTRNENGNEKIQLAPTLLRGDASLLQLIQDLPPLGVEFILVNESPVVKRLERGQPFIHALVIV